VQANLGLRVGEYQSSGFASNRNTHPEWISLPGSRTSSSVHSLESHNSERIPAIQASSAAEVFHTDIGNKEDLIPSSDTHAKNNQSLSRNTSNRVASTSPEQTKGGKEEDNESLSNLEEIEYDTVWYLWALSDKKPLDGAAKKILLKVDAFLIVSSTFGLVLFAISLQGFSIVPFLDPSFFLITVCLILIYYESFVIGGKLGICLRAVMRKRKNKQDGEQNKNEQQVETADMERARVLEGIRIEE